MVERVKSATTYFERAFIKLVPGEKNRTRVGTMHITEKPNSVAELVFCDEILKEGLAKNNSFEVSLTTPPFPTTVKDETVTNQDDMVTVIVPSTSVTECDNIEKISHTCIEETTSPVKVVNNLVNDMPNDFDTGNLYCTGEKKCNFLLGSDNLHFSVPKHENGGEGPQIYARPLPQASPRTTENVDEVKLLVYDLPHTPEDDVNVVDTCPQNSPNVDTYSEFCFGKPTVEIIDDFADNPLSVSCSPSGSIVYPHSETLVNGLFLKPEYYAKDIGRDFLVAYVETEYAGYKVRQKLWNSSYRTLFGKNWLSAYTIEIALFAMTRSYERTDILILDCDITKDIFSKTNKFPHRKPFQKTVFSSLKTILMPFNVRETHWVLLVAHVEKKQFEILDSLNYLLDKRALLQSFLNFMRFIDNNSMTFDTIKWRLKEWQNHPLQTDVYSCGVFVIYYGECLIAGKPFQDELDVQQYRKFVQNYILENSNYVVDLCLFCGGEDTDTQWIMCDACGRWIHSLTCLDGKENNNRAVGKSDTYFYCPLCTHNANIQDYCTQLTEG